MAEPCSVCGERLFFRKALTTFVSYTSISFDALPDPPSITQGDIRLLFAEHECCEECAAPGRLNIRAEDDRGVFALRAMKNGMDLGSEIDVNQHCQVFHVHGEKTPI